MKVKNNTQSQLPHARNIILEIKFQIYITDLQNDVQKVNKVN